MSSMLCSGEAPVGWSHAYTFSASVGSLGVSIASPEALTAGRCHHHHSLRSPELGLIVGLLFVRIGELVVELLLDRPEMLQKACLFSLALACGITASRLPIESRRASIGELFRAAPIVGRGLIIKRLIATHSPVRFLNVRSIHKHGYINAVIFAEFISGASVSMVPTCSLSFDCASARVQNQG